jgi:hypothetical protein
MITRSRLESRVRLQLRSALGDMSREFESRQRFVALKMKANAVQVGADQRVAGFIDPLEFDPLFFYPCAGLTRMMSPSTTWQPCSVPWRTWMQPGRPGGPRRGRPMVQRDLCVPVEFEGIRPPVPRGAASFKDATG